MKEVFLFANGSFMPVLIALIVIGVAAFIIALWMISFYNRTKVKKANIENSFAQLDTQFKRRNDLIPNLVETVKGYAKHESKTLQEVVSLRNSAQKANTTADKLEANMELSEKLRGFNAVVESYPQLKADTSFNKLQSELTETENKIGHFRQFFNDSVLIYNRAVITFPNNVLAKIFGFKKEEYLVTKEKEREAVEVKF